jgi:hypothetical protein
MNSSAADDLDHEPLNGQQLCSLEAVVALVAHRKGEKPETLEKQLREEYGVDHFSKITQGNYRDAMEFLIDLNMDEIRSKK